ncbi:Kae1-like domain-containing protein [Terrisporobacter vanillatitrophus]|uniref:Kae1-like domain-containing protein n=1 Tax=Terrisporobacter vanillatitrophus TaxID=3058402 RepID=UPI00336691D0
MKSKTPKLFKIEEIYIDKNNNSLGSRFDNQATCCKNCDINFILIDKYSREYSNEKKIIAKVKKLLKVGKIIAIKGLEGFHFVCDGTNHKAIANLRKRKNIKSKSLALMMKDINEVKNYCYINEKEKSILSSSKKPIVILKKKNNKLPNNISFNRDSFGVMLPYTPLHSMLFDDELKVLVMTSGNISGMPMIYKNEDALEKLKDIADFFLIHNKEIYVPEEDSVVKVILNEERMIRMGRGYTPINYYNQDYFYDDFLKDNHIKQLSVYHQHAHIVSCMFENNISEKVIGLCFDGFTYEKDKNLWGSEFLICDNKSFKRVGHLNYMKMPGGENAAKEPWKMAVSLLESWSRNKSNLPVEELISNLSINNLFSYIKYKNYHTILYMIKNDVNTPHTSSMGRLFDGISAFLNFQKKISYEGEACLELENLAKKSINTKDYYKFEINYENNQFIVDTDYIIEEVFKEVINNINPCEIAMKFHNTIVEFSFRICLYLRKLYHLNIVALSGEVFENEIIFTKLYEKLSNNNFQILTHKILPCNDSSLPIGQLIINMNKEL